ncbi:hypothetical protein [Pseudomonas amygdali]|uniref:CHASE3 domain-containing protein n=1 Tax=Pseudomonas amygdali TaxID=47877 RepID=UPI0039A0D2F4
MTILQRVIGGFAVLVVLLLAMAGISYQSTHSISDRISIITGQSAPLSRAASELYVHVLRANQALLGFWSAMTPSRLTMASSPSTTAWPGSISCWTARLPTSATALNCATT